MIAREREQANREFPDSLRQRKRLRKRRASIHSAMTKAKQMQGARRKGTSKVFDVNMETLGFRVDRDYARRGPHKVRDPKTGTMRMFAADVLDKYHPVSR